MNLHPFGLEPKSSVSAIPPYPHKCAVILAHFIPGSQLRDVFMKLKKQNIRAFSYWCAYDPGDIWDAAKQSYSVIFRNDDEWSPSKRAEGIREGIEDYTLLKMLEDKDPASYKEIINSITPENRPAMRKKILEKLNR